MEPTTIETAHIPKKGIIRDYWETIYVVLIFVLFARTWVFQNSKIPSASMESTLLIGDRLLVNSFIYGPIFWEWEGNILPIRPIERGDIVVFKYPGEPMVPFIKRVIAKGGDVVQIVNNQMYLNGKRVDEPFINVTPFEKSHFPKEMGIPLPKKIPLMPCFFEDENLFRFESYTVPPQLNYGPIGQIKSTFGPYRIPLGHIFVMGDNRNNSADGRFFGALDESMILGRAWIIWWSYPEKPGDWQRNSPRDIALKLWDKILHIIPGSRWERTFLRPQ